MPESLVEARWLPAYAVTLPDGTELEPGSTHTVPKGEAEESDNWQPIKASRKSGD